MADGLIPGADGMPAPSSLDIGGRQLDVVLTSRPDLADDLRRALAAAGDVDDAIAWVEALRADDPAAYDALVTAVVAGYYLHPEVKRLLGYPGRCRQRGERRQLSRLRRRGPAGAGLRARARSTARRRACDHRQRKIRAVKRRRLVLLALPTACFLAACGGSLTIGSIEDKLNEQIPEEVADVGVDVSGVDCPDDASVEVGSTFECDVTAVENDQDVIYTATVTVETDDSVSVGAHRRSARG